MAETILSVIAEGVLNKIGSTFQSEISLACGVKKDLKTLQTTLSTIKAVLLDAEEQQSKNHAMRDWLEKLKDVVYDADDVLDEFSTEALRRKVEIQGSMLKVAGNFFSGSNPLVFRFKIGHKIKDIRETLDVIAADRRNFQLTEQVVSCNRVDEENRLREPTHSFVLPSNVFGRKEDKERLVELVLSFGDHEDVSVLPIVGLGGLGKTTLAKLVYNDDRVIQSFGTRIWVCVSEEFKLNKVIEKIINATGDTCNTSDMDQLQIRLRGILYTKKFLLVLDDVWNDDPKWWMELRDLLIGGALGSTVIVTTRSKKIATIMGTIESYDLSKLPFDDCLSLLMSCAFKVVPEKVDPELVMAGKEIVHKCGGVPLAVKTLGSLLYMKTDVREWLYIKDNDVWKLEQKKDGIMPALKLSYQQLPSYLKQCFAYCSIFPKDYEMNRFELINYWMAQGFLQSTDERRQMEDVGSQYLNELVSRSFFEDVVCSFDSEISTFKIHDLMHDLTRLMMGTECLDVDFNSKVIDERVRHITFNEDNLLEEEFPTSLLGARKLRSFSFAYAVEPVSKPFIHSLILHFRCLRVLDLSGSEFEELPGFVGNLKHLRFLDLSWNCRIKALPISICKLLNLQTLFLENCDQLRGLPRGIEKLINLRFLTLTSQLSCLPERGLQGLASLQHLELFQCNRLTSLSEGFQHLTSLRRLEIDNCPSLTSLPSGMEQLTALELVSILNCNELNLLEGEDMQGLRSLRTLYIEGLPKMVALPRGLQQSAATLQYLCIKNCCGLTTLPEWLQTLASLRRLYIKDCPNVLSLPDAIQGLTALQILKISRCPHLSRRCIQETGDDWPKISHIPNILLK